MLEIQRGSNIPVVELADLRRIICVDKHTLQWYLRTKSASGVFPKSKESYIFTIYHFIFSDFTGDEGHLCL
ncbi:Bgt-20835 [Blumeria graminis f. sp. tritici]|uniref:Bgt-20835 n=2 Tax=Blumeria graminis f. sp. tritici TaxID=62690 RepID=A0A9X9PSV8_BLUGR|nr:Bgt-20835 [Blumeria graminis f. sp. tritici]